MRITIKLEQFAHGGASARHLSGGPAAPYVARVLGIIGYTGQFKREHLRGYLDYSKANSVGSRGVFKFYFLDNGLYEVFERLTWKRTRQYFLLVKDGATRELTIEEAIAWLNHPTPIDAPLDLPY